MSYRKAVQCYDERWEDGDPDGALWEAIRHLDVVPKSNGMRIGTNSEDCACMNWIAWTEGAEDEFRAALSLEPDHQWARLYLGHSLFDQDRFAEALEQFEGVQEDFFAKRQQDWRILKKNELRLCCKFHLTKRGLSFDAFDPLQAPVTTEIATCIETLVSEGRIKPAKLRRWVWRLQDLIAHLNLKPV